MQLNVSTSRTWRWKWRRRRRRWIHEKQTVCRLCSVCAVQLIADESTFHSDRRLIREHASRWNRAQARVFHLPSAENAAIQSILSPCQFQSEFQVMHLAAHEKQERERNTLLRSDRINIVKNKTNRSVCSCSYLQSISCAGLQKWKWKSRGVVSVQCNLYLLWLRTGHLCSIDHDVSHRAYLCCTQPIFSPP